MFIFPDISFAGLWDVLVDTENERIAEEARERYLYGNPVPDIWDTVWYVTKFILALFFLLAMVFGVVLFIRQLFVTPDYDHELGIYKLTPSGGVYFMGENYQLKDGESLISVEEFKLIFDGELKRGRKHRFACFEKNDENILEIISLTRGIFRESE